MSKKDTNKDLDINFKCYMMAKDAKDPEWDKMLKYRDLWKKSCEIIVKKYSKYLKNNKDKGDK